jgi:hypothetical protein
MKLMHSVAVLSSCFVTEGIKKSLDEMCWAMLIEFFVATAWHVIMSWIAELASGYEQL